MLISELKPLETTKPRTLKSAGLSYGPDTGQA